jgi:choline dehydrogenase
VQAGRGHRSVRAGEVILCGGAINTPQILQLSGVGSARLLESLGLAVVADLPGVGDNLQDHLEVYVQFANRLPVSVDPSLSWLKKLGVGVQWLLQRKGLGATNHFEGGGFCRSNPDVDYPNLMFHFLPMAVRYDGSKPAAGPGYQVHVGPMYSDARGWVRVRSRDPMQHPALQFNYLSTDQDRREWVEAIRIARRILNQPAMEPYNGGEISPGVAVASDAEILDWVRRDAETALHPSCTAKMGVGEDAVLDPVSMRVRGLDGIRVVDASVFPCIPNGNTYAPVMMVAEKSADLILGNTPLPPSDAPFYRWRDGSALHPPGDPRNEPAAES